MIFWAKVCLLLLLAIPLDAGPVGKCRDPIIRKEWRTLSVLDRRSYISAVQCVMKKPALTSTSDLPGVSSRFEDYLGTHILQTPNVHFVGVFYPWHRLFLHAYEKELRSCGYRGAQPYWDWTLDTGSKEDFIKSPIFDPETGFGGNGDWVPGNASHPAHGVEITSGGLDMPDRTGGGCIPNGPFKNAINNLGPNNNIEYNPHCIRRDFTPSRFIGSSSQANVTDGMRLPDFASFDRITETSFHGGGHLGVGGLYGTMTDGYASPGDPLFYLHHANMDRAWWSWQHRKLPARVADIAAPLVAFDYANEKSGNATLDTIIRIGTTVNITTTVRDVMHIQSGLLCYMYDKLY